MKIKRITVFGHALAKPQDPVFREAFEVCKLLGQKGFVIVNGGGPGVMRAASLGAKTGGGKVIGVTFYPTESEIFEGRDIKNPLDEEFKTRNYVERTLKLLELGDVYLVFRGAAGTISEFGMAWELGHLYFGHNKPILLYGKFWHKIIEVLKKYMLLVPEELQVFSIVERPGQVFEKLTEIEKKWAEIPHKHLRKTEAAFQL